METTASFTDHPITHPVSVPIFGHRIAGFTQQGETHGREEATASVAFEINSTSELSQRVSLKCGEPLGDAGKQGPHLLQALHGQSPCRRLAKQPKRPTVLGSKHG